MNPLSLYLLLLAALLLFINMRTSRSRAAKAVTYWGMWAAIVASLVLAVATS